MLGRTVSFFYNYKANITGNKGIMGTYEDERTVLFKTISLDGIKPNTNPKTNPKTNPNPNTNPCLLYTSPSPRD